MFLSSFLGLLSCWTVVFTLARSAQVPLSPLTPLRLFTAEEPSLCPQVLPLHPSNASKAYDAIVSGLLEQKSFRHRAFEALGVAIRVPTESYDDLGPVGEDPRWDTFALLHAALEETFPLVYKSLEVTKVNTYGIVLHWQGSDTETLPVLITAHQDVVPVEPATVDDWIQPPYSGYYDGEWIWGRGSVDDKSDVISILITIDTLLQHGFEPTRTFVVAFGFDEEASSLAGAGHLTTYLEDTYGADGFATLLDEGGGYGTLFGGDVIFASPSTSEKGYLDVRVEVSTLGGHSSVPPPHTGIGILAAAIVAIEAHPHSASLTRTGTAFEMLECAAEYGPGIPDAVKTLVKRAATDDDALEELSQALPRLDPRFSAVISTTQAVDIVRGGVKVNALPERVEAVINHRIAEDSSVGALQAAITDVVLPVAKAFDLTVDSFGKNVTAGSGAGGHLALSDAWATAIEPAPKTPTANSAPWELLSGTIKAALEESDGYKNSTVIVTPTLAVGNTDTRWYWNLTRHIYRYSHTADAGTYGGIHTVNEAISGEAFVDKIRFHTKFILNWDESSL